jgi:hypothetical protein
MVPTDGGASALMSICAELYRQLPMLADIEIPREWAIDPSKDQSKGPQYYDGYGCDNLGDADSIWTSSAGSLLLHEIMHFPGLFYDVPGYKANIATFYDENTPHFISDYFGMWPQDGYGREYSLKDGSVLERVLVLLCQQLTNVRSLQRRRD